MKKIGILLLLALFTLAGCGKDDTPKVLFTNDMAQEFEIVQYKQAIAPVMENLTPYIAYAKTEGQLKEQIAHFDLEQTEIDMDKYMAVFVTTYSNGCGVQVDNVYNRDGMLSVQLIFPESDNCDKEGVPHTFLIKVPKGDYTKVQLYDQAILKSTLEVKE